MFLKIGDSLFNLDNVVSIKPESSSVTGITRVRIKTIDGTEYVEGFRGQLSEVVDAVAIARGIVKV